MHMDTNLIKPILKTFTTQHEQDKINILYKLEVISNLILYLSVPTAKNVQEPYLNLRFTSPITDEIIHNIIHISPKFNL